MSFGVWFVVIYPVILTWYQRQVKGHLRYWSRFEAGVTVHDDCSQDILFLTIFGPKELFHCVQSIISSEDTLSFHMKRFLFSPATVILQFWRYTIFFCSHHLFLFALFLFQSLFIYFTRFVTSFYAYALSLCLKVILANQKKKKSFFLSCICSQPYASVWSRPIKSSEKSL